MKNYIIIQSYDTSLKPMFMHKEVDSNKLFDLLESLEILYSEAYDEYGSAMNFNDKITVIMGNSQISFTIKDLFKSGLQILITGLK